MRNRTAVRFYGRAILQDRRDFYPSKNIYCTAYSNHPKIERFKNKFRGGSRRLKGWDYSADALYFITIVSAGREYYFGDIRNDKIICSDFGKIVQKEWFKSFEIRGGFFCDEFVVMPNHLHGIVGIDNIAGKSDGSAESRGVESHGRAILQPKSGAVPPKNIRKPKSISSFIAGFKSAAIRAIDDWIDETGSAIPKFNRLNPL